MWNIFYRSGDILSAFNAHSNSLFARRLFCVLWGKRIKNGGWFSLCSARDYLTVYL